MRKTTLIIATMLLALPLAGCIQNMADLKDRVGATTEDEPVEPASTTPTVTTPQPNTTKVLKAPVARVTIFGSTGALLFKSTFQADDPADILFVPVESKLSLIASDSEALEAGATLATFAWSMDGKPVAAARQANVEIKEAGLYVITLNVTDSNGMSDEQTVKVGVAPEPYEVVTELVTGPIAGAEGQGNPGALSFDLALPTDKPATAQGIRIVASPGAACDAILTVTDPAGTASSVDEGGLGGDEEIDAAMPPVGAYAISVEPFACVEPEGVPVTVIVTFLPTVEGLGDPHGGHPH